MFGGGSFLNRAHPHSPATVENTIINLGVFMGIVYHIFSPLPYRAYGLFTIFCRLSRVELEELVDTVDTGILAAALNER